MKSHIQNIEIDAEELPVLAPEDTAIIKILLQRGSSEGKFDMEDIESIKQSIDLDKDYILQRSKNLGIEDYTDSLTH